MRREQLVGERGCLRRRVLRAHRRSGRTGRLLEHVQRILHRQVSQFHQPLLNAIVLGELAQLADFASHGFNCQVLSFHHGSSLSLKGDQAGSVIIPFGHTHQRQLSVED